MLPLRKEYLYKVLKIENVMSEIQRFCLKYSTKLWQHTNVEMYQLLEETTQDQIRKL